MSFQGQFQAIVARYGVAVTLQLEGETLGSGLALLRPLLDRERKFLHTDLGVRRQELTLCLGQVEIPFPDQPGELVLKTGQRTYDVVNARLIGAGEEQIYWRAVLARREEESP